MKVEGPWLEFRSCSLENTYIIFFVLILVVVPAGKQVTAVARLHSDIAVQTFLLVTERQQEECHLACRAFIIEYEVERKGIKVVLRGCISF